MKALIEKLKALLSKVGRNEDLDDADEREEDEILSESDDATQYHVNPF